MFNLFSIFKKKGEPPNRMKDFEMETIMENIRDGVIIYDTNFTILSMNEAALKITGISAEETLGKTIEPGLINNPRLRTLTQIIFPSLAPSMATISANGWPQIIDITLEEPRTELRTVLNRVINDKNEVVAFMKLVTDMTREKGVLDSKSEFISVAAHQLRTPLTAINWSFESLNKILGGEKPDMAEAANLAKEGWQLTERSLKIVNDLLNAARIEEGRFGFNFEETDLAEFVGIITKQSELAAKEYGIKIVFSPGNQVFRVRIDKELMGIAFANLLDNAMKYNVKNGEVVVSLESDPVSYYAKLVIKDTGVGIPEEEIKKLFQKFYRGTNVIQMEPNGSGLGLYITKNIIEGQGGKISVISQPGRGTSFSVILPTIKS
ncbi:MAG: ATP-binding protein [Patescibacteria group bacterium]